MEQGHFYFIKDDFYTIHDKEQKLMRNKDIINEMEHRRPCFYAFRDHKIAEIFWFVPISSKLNKYTGIYNAKLQRQKENANKIPKCNTICFGEVMGYPRVFLIQNIFPIIGKYIESVYIDNNTKKPVTIEPLIERMIINNSKDILRLVNHGHHNLVFFDIIKIYNDLCAELKNK